MHSYSQDLRDRVLWALERGEGPSAIARRLEVSRVWVYHVRIRKEQTGMLTSLPIGGHRRSRIADMETELRSWIEALPTMNAEKLVFIDETWTSTNMTRRYGRAPRGQRCHGSAPYSHWQVTTFVGALRRRGISAPMVIDEPIDGDVFLAYVQQVLVPTLTAGEIVIFDNLGSHKVDGVQEAIQSAGATVLYLPPYSPDLNPIENFFAKLKALLRKAAKRSTEALWEEIGNLLQSISPEECSNYLTASGYVNT